MKKRYLIFLILCLFCITGCKKEEEKPVKQTPLIDLSKQLEGEWTGENHTFLCFTYQNGTLQIESGTQNNTETIVNGTVQSYEEKENTVLFTVQYDTQPTTRTILVDLTSIETKVITVRMEEEETVRYIYEQSEPATIDPVVDSTPDTEPETKPKNSEDTNTTLSYAELAMLTNGTWYSEQGDCLSFQYDNQLLSLSLQTKDESPRIAKVRSFTRSETIYTVSLYYAPVEASATTPAQPEKITEMQLDIIEAENAKLTVTTETLTEVLFIEEQGAIANPGNTKRYDANILPLMEKLNGYWNVTGYSAYDNTFLRFYYRNGYACFIQGIWYTSVGQRIGIIESLTQLSDKTWQIQIYYPAQAASESGEAFEEERIELVLDLTLYGDKRISTKLPKEENDRLFLYGGNSHALRDTLKTE